MHDQRKLIRGSSGSCRKSNASHAPVGPSLLVIVTSCLPVNARASQRQLRSLYRSLLYRHYITHITHTSHHRHFRHLPPLPCIELSGPSPPFASKSPSKLDLNLVYSPSPPTFTSTPTHHEPLPSCLGSRELLPHRIHLLLLVLIVSQPRDDVYGAYDYSHFGQAANGPIQHTQSPIVTGTSVIAVKYSTGVVIAADNLGE